MKISFWGEGGEAEVYNDFLCFGCVEPEVFVLMTARPIWFLPIDFFIVGYESNYGCVSSVLQDDN